MLTQLPDYRLYRKRIESPNSIQGGSVKFPGLSCPFPPGVVGRTDELAGEGAGGRRGQKLHQFANQFHRDSAGLGPFQGLVIFRTGPLPRGNNFVQNLGVDASGSHGIDLDIERLKLHGQGLRQPDQSRLGRRICREPGTGTGSPAAGEVNDLPPPPGLHAGQHRMDGPDRAHQVHLHGPFPGL